MANPWRCGDDAFAIRPPACLISAVLAALILGCPAAAHASVWFARAGADGDGRSEASPTGSTPTLERMSKPGDAIVLLPGEAPLDGGLSLKRGQTLLGLGERKPSITNTDAGRHGGSGLVLADECKVFDLRVRDTKGSGIIGVDVSGACLIGVDVDGSNRSSGFTEYQVGLLGKVCHGGILFIVTKPGKETENRLVNCGVTDAPGIGIGSFAFRGGKIRLIVGGSRSEGGTPILPLLDMGVAIVAEGEGSVSSLEMSGSSVSGRLGRQGRNLLAFASAGGRATARIERSTSGESGQDGIIGVASMTPATVELVIRDSTIEKAAQINLEGTILNLPPSDPKRADGGIVSIDVERCVIRDAGFVDGFREEAQNIWLAPSVLAERSFAGGHYRLSLRDSTVEKARKGGIIVGNAGSDFKLDPDGGEYDVFLSGNTIRDNGRAELEIAAEKARVDARRNFWGKASGLDMGKVRFRDRAKASQLNASEPLDRAIGQPD